MAEQPVTQAGPASADQGQQLSTIFEIAKILVTRDDLETMLSLLLPTLVRTLEAADAGSLWLHDADTGFLEVKAARGYDLNHLRQIHLAPGEGFAGRVYLSGRPELYPTAESAAAAMASMTPRNQELFQKATVGVRRPLSAICVPLGTGDRRIGALALLNLRRPGSFSGSDLSFLHRVADLITIATENAQLHEELERTQAISEANRLKAEVISILAHEMRTPLTSIKGYATALLMDEVTFSPESQREFLQFIDDECDVLQSLIHDLLESSIIEAGLLRLELQPVRLPPLVEGIVDEMSRRSSQHRFFVDFARDFPILDADPDRIGQVLRNLLDNALKYSPEGGLIVVRGETGSDEAVVSVADQGLGIAPEHLNRLFEKFFRARSPLGRHVVGSGLGLPICRTVIDGHGGRIWAESVLGQGSTFFFTVPLKHANQGPGEQETPDE